ncbi:hypothetical protein [Streptomyces sp. NPDC056255]|uniref:hypothetical protein n=1 Tax=Streptomyces sp. NPDC056255 TaxID=3345764 RepID=UPI0035DE5DD6
MPATDWMRGRRLDAVLLDDYGADRWAAAEHADLWRRPDPDYRSLQRDVPAGPTPA